MERRDFDVDAFLSRPLTAHLATTRPAVRPVWFLWEARCFWVLTGPWSTAPADIAANPLVALAVDTCNLETGECRQVIARGHADLLPFEPERLRRKLGRYLGPDPATWDRRFHRYLTDEAEAQWARIIPTSLVAKDLSFAPSLA